MPTVEVGSENGSPISIFYADQGQGEPVVLIHGWPLSLRSWEAQIDPLVEAGYRVIAYDRRGFGGSSQPYSGYDYDTFAADLDKLLTTLDLTGVTLVGFSMGGGEVARYVSQYGTSRVKAAVFAAAVPPYLYKSSENEEGALDDATIEGFLQGASTDRLGFLDGFTTNFFTAGGDLKVSEPARLYALHIAEWASPKATLECIKAFAYTDFRSDIAKFDIPTLVIHGDSDAIVPFEASGKRTAELIPNSQLVVIKDGPHGINASHAEEFNSALISFLSESSSSAYPSESSLTSSVQ